MGTVEVQLIERDREEVTKAVCIHLETPKAPSLSNGCSSKPSSSHRMSQVSPEWPVMQHSSQPPSAQAGSVKLCSQKLEFVVQGQGVMLAAEQPVSTPACCSGERTRENCFTFCKRIEGGSVISSGIKATRKLLESPFYKSPFEKHLPSPWAIQYVTICANI